MNSVLLDTHAFIFKPRSSKNVSFVDCVTIALMRANRLDAIFSFAEVYKSTGLITIPG